MSRLIPALLAVACLATPALAAEPQPVRGGTLTYAVANDTDTRDCHKGQSFSALHHLAPHYSLLLKIDPKHTPDIIGDLAQSWTVSPDALTYTFKLHPGVRFHDGSVLTAEDVKASYARMWQPPPGVALFRTSLLEDLAAIETPDAGTVVFRLQRPNASMLETFASPWNCIYSAARLKEDPQFPEKTVMGTGPFRFVEEVKGSHWVGERFDGYFHAGRPWLDGFRAVTLSSSALVNAMAGGQVDAEFRGVAPSDAQKVKASRGDVTFHEIEGMSLFLLTFNTEKKPFDDVRVRRALSLAIDRWGGAAPLSRISYLKHVSGFQRPGAPMALSPQDLATLPGFGRDIKAAREEAKRLLAEAGVPGLKIQLLNRGPAMPYTPAALYVLDQWRQIGVTAEQTVVEVPAWVQRRIAGNFEVVLDSMGEWSDDPSFALARFTSAEKTANISRAVDPEIDDLYERQKRTLDPAERKRLVGALEQRLISQAYTVPLFRGEKIVGLAGRVHGFDLYPTHMTPGNLEDLWLGP